METFESGKTIKELGIDITRKFIVIREGNFKKGDILTFYSGDDTSSPFFKNQEGKVDYTGLHNISYYQEEELTLPRWVYVSDKSKEQALEGKTKSFLFHILPENKEYRYVVVESGDTLENGNYFYRWKYIAEIPEEVPKEKMTIKQIEEALGKKIEIID